MASKKGDPRLSRQYKANRLKKLAMDGYTCFYCGAEDKDMTIDHVVPVSKAPDMAISIENMVSSCKSCNSRKGARSQGVFLAQVRTPLDFPVHLSPMRSEIVADSPFTVRPKPLGSE